METPCSEGRPYDRIRRYQRVLVAMLEKIMASSDTHFRNAVVEAPRNYTALHQEGENIFLEPTRQPLHCTEASFPSLQHGERLLGRLREGPHH